MQVCRRPQWYDYIPSSASAALRDAPVEKFSVPSLHSGSITVMLGFPDPWEKDAIIVGKIQTLSHDSCSIEIEVYNNGKIHRLVKLLFFIYECAGILLIVYILPREC